MSDERIRYFDVPMLPESKNQWQRMHWAKRQRIKEAWEEMVWGYVNKTPRMPRPLDSVRCSLIVCWNKPGPLPDHHNLEMGFECVADGLVKAGIIRDDSGMQFVRGQLTLCPGDGSTLVVLRWEEKA